MELHIQTKEYGELIKLFCDESLAFFISQDHYVSASPLELLNEFSPFKVSKHEANFPFGIFQPAAEIFLGNSPSLAPNYVHDFQEVCWKRELLFRNRGFNFGIICRFFKGIIVVLFL